MRWRGVESDHKPVERVRACALHRVECYTDERRDTMLCPAGHVIDGGGWIVVKVGTVPKVYLGGIAMARVAKARTENGGGRRHPTTVVSQFFQDSAGMVLRVRLQRGARVPFEVRVVHEGQDGKRVGSGVMATAHADDQARKAFEHLCAEAQRMGWKPLLQVRKGSLSELPAPKPAIAAAARRA